MLDSGYWILDSGYWILDTRYWILDSGFWILDSRYWILDYLTLRLCEHVTMSLSKGQILDFNPFVVLCASTTETM